MTIGGIWLAHHSIFGRLRYVDSTLMRINLLLLLAASFLPFPTRTTLLAVLAPHVAAFGYLLASIALVLRARGHDRPAPA